MKRRKFIKNSVYMTSGALALSATQTGCNSKSNPDSVTGFIISDAHIGWKGKEQPTVELQGQVIQHIKDRFPDLDLVFDTGDIHHGNLSESQRLIARDQWLSKMANIFSQSLFHYIPGNHELGRGVNDTELTASKLGSQNLKPYYSFDYKGIHFISLPQLMDTLLVNQESLDWLAQDLEINQSKTTLILSHNSIDNTTFNNGETGYRIVINSDEVLEVINRYDNVIAWLHGHNHQYEIVKKHNRLYVSNGRIGGFNPPKKWGNFGQGHLGGIYFKVDKNGLQVKCYSATKQKFFEEFGDTHLSIALKLQTTFSASAPTNYYYGYGALTQNLKIRIYNHYLSNKNSEVYLKQNLNNVINDNFDFRFSNDLFFAGRDIKRIMGFSVEPSSLDCQAAENGLKINNINKVKSILVKFPNQKKNNEDNYPRSSYYRCYPKDRYKISISTSIEKNNQNSLVFVTYIIRNQRHEKLYISDKISVIKINNKYELDNIEIPDSILSSNSDLKYYLHTSIEFKNFPVLFTVRSIKLEKITANNQDERNTIQINAGSKQYELQNNKLIQNKMIDLSMPNIQSKTCILVKVPNVQWQIRNAIAELDDHSINVLEYRHQFQKSRMVVLTPTFNPEFFINTVVDLMPFKITYMDNKIICESDSYHELSTITVISKNKPKSIIGAKLLSYDENNLKLHFNSKKMEIIM